MKTIGREELKAMMDRGEDLILLEVLPESSYRQAHLPGAILFQGLDSIPELLPDKDAFIVAYCSNYN